MATHGSTLIPYKDALLSYYKKSDNDRLGLTRRDYRDYIVGTYLGATDDSYKHFIDRLSSADRGSALGMDLLLLGLSGATALAGPSAIEELATVTAITTGARASIDKRLFYDRTLPAVIAAMDAERAAIKVEIERKRGLPVEQYSLDTAIDDLRRLAEAGRLDRAFARITKVAIMDRSAQEARLNAMKGVCDDITIAGRDLNYEFYHLVTDEPARQNARLAAAADELSVTVPAGQVVTYDDLVEPFDEQLCDDGKKAQFIERLKAKIATQEAGG